MRYTNRRILYLLALLNATQQILVEINSTQVITYNKGFMIVYSNLVCKN